MWFPVRVSNSRVVVSVSHITQNRRLTTKYQRGLPQRLLCTGYGMQTQPHAHGGGRCPACSASAVSRHQLLRRLKILHAPALQVLHAVLLQTPHWPVVSNCRILHACMTHKALGLRLAVWSAHTCKLIVSCQCMSIHT